MLREEDKMAKSEICFFHISFQQLGEGHVRKMRFLLNKSVKKSDTYRTLHGPYTETCRRVVLPISVKNVTTVYH